MSFYNIHDKIDFGINQGYTVAEIYHYAPQYIKYLLTDDGSHEFCADLEALKSLGNPARFDGDEQIDKRINQVRIVAAVPFEIAKREQFKFGHPRNEGWEMFNKIEEIVDQQLGATGFTLGEKPQKIEYIKLVVKTLGIEPTAKPFDFIDTAKKNNADRRSKFKK